MTQYIKGLLSKQSLHDPVRIFNTETNLATADDLLQCNYCDLFVQYIDSWHAFLMQLFCSDLSTAIYYNMCRQQDIY